MVHRFGSLARAIAMSLLFGWGCVLAERVGSAQEVDPAALAENKKDALAHNAARRSGFTEDRCYQAQSFGL